MSLQVGRTLGCVLGREEAVGNLSVSSCLADPSRRFENYGRSLLIVSVGGAGRHSGSEGRNERGDIPSGFPRILEGA